MNIKLTFSALVMFGFTLAFTSSAQAQVSQTFVSVEGKDNSTCDAPDKACRNIQLGITKVQAGGEVVILTSGSYQPFTINKAVTVVAAPDIHVSINTTSGDGVIINSAPADVVILRGLTFNGLGGIVGIQFMSGGELHVENCIASGFSAHGIGLGPASKFFAQDVILRNNAGSGILLNTVGDGTITASLDRISVVGNGTGINIQKNVRVTLRDAVVTGNKFLGIVAGTSPAGTTTEVTIENCQITGNLSGPVAGGGDGNTVMNVSDSIIANNSGAGINSFPNGLIRVSNTTIVHNGSGLLVTGGSILSRLNNTVEGNTNDGSFTGTFLAK